MAGKTSSKKTKISEKKPRAKKITRTKNLKFTQRVPEEYVFWCCDGRRFADMRELAEGLNTMSDEVYVYHVNAEKNDFYNWVRDIIEDVELADTLLQATGRIAAGQCVNDRLAFLID